MIYIYMIYISYIYDIYIYMIYILTIAEHFYTITESKGKDEDTLRTQKDIYNIGTTLYKEILMSKISLGA